MWFMNLSLGSRGEAGNRRAGVPGQLRGKLADLLAGGVLLQPAGALFLP